MVNDLHRTTFELVTLAVFISVALSSRSRALGITQQPALWCPDFPHFFRNAAVCTASRPIIAERNKALKQGFDKVFNKVRQVHITVV